MSTLSGVFNWTLSYRWDSDLTMPYGWVDPIDQDTRRMPPSHRQPLTRWIEYDNSTILRRIREGDSELLRLAKRPRMVSWIVSDCRPQSKRDEYALELGKHIDLAVYGRCGEDCGKFK